MPFIDPQKKQQPQPGAAPLERAGSAASPAPAAPAVGSPAPAATTPRPGGASAGLGHVNLSTVLGLNRDAGASMAGKVAGRVQREGDAAQGALAGAKASHAQALGAGTLTYDESKVGNDYAKAGALAAQAFTPPAFGDAALDSQVARGAEAARGLDSGGGFNGLLQQETGTRTTTGGSALNAFLGGQAGAPVLDGARQRYGGLEAALGLAKTEAQGATTSARAAHEAAQAQYAKLGEELRRRERAAARRKPLTPAEIAERRRAANPHVPANRDPRAP